ncbi:hypothetical protein, partial [Flavobacterium taihuense]
LISCYSLFSPPLLSDLRQQNQTEYYFQYYVFSTIVPLALLPTFWHYSGFGVKLSPIFGFAK